MVLQQIGIGLLLQRTDKLSAGGDINQALLTFIALEFILKAMPYLCGQGMNKA
jgi:hypothetical protein